MNYIKDINAPKGESKAVSAAGLTIQVRQSIPSLEKYSFIKATVANATEEDGKICDWLLNVAFEINLIKVYTDLMFEDEDNANIYDTYDKLVASGVVDAVVGAIPADDYNELFEAVEKEARSQKEFTATFAGGVANVLYQLQNSEKLLEQFKNTINSFDKEQVQNVVSLAEKAGFQGQ